MLWICAEISSVAFAVWLASAFTSLATTAKPRPCSPARAASMVAFSASRLVWLAMFWISVTTSPIFWVPLAQPFDHRVGAARLVGGLAAISAERVTCWRDAADRCGQLFGRGGDRLDIAGGLDRGGGDGARSAARFLRCCCSSWTTVPCISRGGDRDRLDDAADAAFEAGGELAPRRVAVLLGPLLDFAALGVGARLRRLSRLRPRGLHRRGLEQLLQLVAPARSARRPRSAGSPHAARRGRNRSRRDRSPRAAGSSARGDAARRQPCAARIGR